MHNIQSLMFVTHRTYMNKNNAISYQGTLFGL